jgi:hypothetical protein
MNKDYICKNSGSYGKVSLSMALHFYGVQITQAYSVALSSELLFAVLGNSGLLLCCAVQWVHTPKTQSYAQYKCS